MQNTCCFIILTRLLVWTLCTSRKQICTLTLISEESRGEVQSSSRGIRLHFLIVSLNLFMCSYLYVELLLIIFNFVDTMFTLQARISVCAVDRSRGLSTSLFIYSILRQKNSILNLVLLLSPHICTYRYHACLVNDGYVHKYKIGYNMNEWISP